MDLLHPAAGGAARSVDAGRPGHLRGPRGRGSHRLQPQGGRGVPASGAQARMLSTCLLRRDAEPCEILARLSNEWLALVRWIGSTMARTPRPFG